jgi:GT2 family glycosyltransferase
VGIRAVDTPMAYLSHVKLKTLVKPLIPARLRRELRRLLQERIGLSLDPSPAALYDAWVGRYDTLTGTDEAAIVARVAALDHKPLVSVVMPVYNTAEWMLRRAIDSVTEQLYPNWELCMADDKSTLPHVRAVLEEYAARHGRIKLAFREHNGGISAASNTALGLVSGDFIALLDHDDELPRHALYMVVEELNAHPDSDLVYSDEDKIDSAGHRYDPYFKSDWNPDLFFSLNLISHLGVYRTTLLRQIGGFREGYEGSQDYDLALRVIERTRPDRIRHIPHVLYHWRAVAGSVALASDEKGYAHGAARRALGEHLQRSGTRAHVVRGYGEFHRLVQPLPDVLPLVSVIASTEGPLDAAAAALATLSGGTDYEPIELLLVGTGPSTGAVTHSSIDRRCHFVPYDGSFSLAGMNNVGARAARGEVLVFIHDDVQPISKEWLREMVSQALRPKIGAVGAKLYYPDDTLEHAGIVAGLRGMVGNPNRGLRRSAPDNLARASVIQGVSAVSGACLTMRRRVFEDIGGFDERNVPTAFTDIDLCFRLQERGYRVIMTPYTELYHWAAGSWERDRDSRMAPRFEGERRHMTRRWAVRLQRDPYYSPNLTIEREDLSLAEPPRADKPWRTQTSVAASVETSNRGY